MKLLYLVSRGGLATRSFPGGPVSNGLTVADLFFFYMYVCKDAQEAQWPHDRPSSPAHAFSRPRNLINRFVAAVAVA